MYSLFFLAKGKMPALNQTKPPLLGGPLGERERGGGGVWKKKMFDSCPKTVHVGGSCFEGVLNIYLFKK
jgi:hypothetical protein